MVFVVYNIKKGEGVGVLTVPSSTVVTETPLSPHDSFRKTRPRETVGVITVLRCCAMFRGFWVLKSPWECKIMICLLRNGTCSADYGY